MTKGVDYVVCRECGHRGAKLYRHIASHGFTTAEYKAQHGEDAPLRCQKTKAKQKASRSTPGTWKETKEVPCPSCSRTHRVGKQMGRLHDLRCPSCRAGDTDALWAGKTEPEDFVTCLECGHRAENLTGHVTKTHPGYRERHPGSPVVALGSAVRDKTALKGRVLSAETRRRMSENAGRWNAGLTKDTDERVAQAAAKMKGRVSWSKGLTAAEDGRLQAAVTKLKTYVGENRPWHNGLRAELTLQDFDPFLDADGCVDRKAISEALGVSWRTIFKYMQTFDLDTSAVHVRARHEAQVIRLDKEVLELGMLGNGKVSVARVMRDTGHSFKVVKRECERHGLPTFTRRGQQTLCLDAVSKALGGISYTMEWESMRFTNPPTRRRFRFDGYFKDVGLVVEFHGHQHYLFPNAFMADESYRPLYDAMRERDRLKKALVDASELTYFLVRYDEPYEDVSYLRGRLVGAGIVAPGGEAGLNTLEMFSGAF